MRYSLSFILLCFIWISSYAQSEYTEPVWLNDLISSYDQYYKLNDEAKGYRIQISYSNDKDEINLKKIDFIKKFPGFRSYVQYEQPYYKLRVGDFKNKLEAARAMDVISAIYPGAFHVKSTIRLYGWRP